MISDGPVEFSGALEYRDSSNFSFILIYFDLSRWSILIVCAFWMAVGFFWIFWTV